MIEQLTKNILNIYGLYLTNTLVEKIRIDSLKKLKFNFSFLRKKLQHGFYFVFEGQKQINYIYSWMDAKVVFMNN